MTAIEDVPLLSIEAIRKSYAGTEVLGPCSLSIRRGEFVTLLGPSGCGKTTMLRAIAGLVRLDAGVVRMTGRVLSSPTVHVPPEQRRMGMVFQSYAVWPHMSVRANVALPLRLRGVATSEIRRRVEEVLTICHLEAMIDRQPHQLSGGQLQRVALARALVYRPDVILLDEPLSNLDVALREELRQELYRIHKEIGGTFVLVTHDQVEAMSLSDRVVVMQGGKIEQIGVPREVYAKPAAPFVARFVGAANIVTGTVLDRCGDSSELDRVDFGPWTLSVQRWSGGETGQSMQFAIHPESLSILPDSARMPANGFGARVQAVYFLGRTQQVVIESNGMTLHAVQMGDRRLAPGDNVIIEVDCRAIVPLAQGSEHRAAEQ